MTMQAKVTCGWVSEDGQTTQRVTQERSTMTICIHGRGSEPRQVAHKKRSLSPEPGAALLQGQARLGHFRARLGQARGISLSLAHHYLWVERAVVHFCTVE